VASGRAKRPRLVLIHKSTTPDTCRFVRNHKHYAPKKPPLVVAVFGRKRNASRQLLFFASYPSAKWLKKMRSAGMGFVKRYIHGRSTDVEGRPAQQPGRPIVCNVEVTRDRARRHSSVRGENRAQTDEEAVPARVHRALPEWSAERPGLTRLYARAARGARETGGRPRCEFLHRVTSTRSRETV